MISHLNQRRPIWCTPTWTMQTTGRATTKRPRSSRRRSARLWPKDSRYDLLPATKLRCNQTLPTCCVFSLSLSLSLSLPFSVSLSIFLSRFFLPSDSIFDLIIFYNCFSNQRLSNYLLLLPHLPPSMLLPSLTSSCYVDFTKCRIDQF